MFDDSKEVMMAVAKPKKGRETTSVVTEANLLAYSTCFDFHSEWNKKLLVGFKQKSGFPWPEFNRVTLMTCIILSFFPDTCYLRIEME